MVLAPTVEVRRGVVDIRHSLVTREARPGMLVRVVEDKRRPEFEGMLGTIRGSFGRSDYPALDVQLEDGRLELFWFHQLDKAEKMKPRTPMPVERQRMDSRRGSTLPFGYYEEC